MKKSSLFLSIAIVLVMIPLFASCGLLNLLPVDDSIPSEVAVSRGEAGSRESFLASQETPTTELRRAFEEAQADGYAGTYYDFLEGLGLTDGAARLQQALRASVSVFAYFSKGQKVRDFYSAGSGTIYDLDADMGRALIVTNYHVVYNTGSTGRETISHVSDDVEVYLYGETHESRAMKATYVGGVMQYDVAVLSVTSDFLKAEDGAGFATELVAADSDSISAGETVYAVGNADGKGVSVTGGVVSVPIEYAPIYAADESTRVNMPEIRIDVALNHGNSGGGLFTANGEFIGVVNARSEEEGILGFGYAIPANLVLSIAQNIIDTCAVDPTVHGAAVAHLGVTPGVATENSLFDAETGKVYTEEKVILESITYSGLADRAGLTEADTLLSLKLTPASDASRTRTVAVTARHKLTQLLFEVRLGDTLELTVSRNGKIETATIEFSSRNCFRTMN